MALPQPTAKQRRILARSGVAMPDGSYYIRNEQELDDAIHAVGRAQPNGNETEDARRNDVRRHIMKLATALKLSSKIPDTWNSDGSLKQSAIPDYAQIGEDFLAHFGRKGMKWGEHVFGRDRTSHPVSEDAAKARQLQSTVHTHGTSALSNAELQHLVTRLNLESQHGRLNPETSHAEHGRRILKGALAGAKTGVDVYNTTTQVVKTINEVNKAVKKVRHD